MAEDGAQLIEELMRFRPEGMTANAWAVRAGVSRTIWSDLKRHGNPSRRTLSKLLEAAGTSLAEFEALRVGPQTSARTGRVAGVGDASASGWRSAPLPLIPLLETRPEGEWGARGSGIELAKLRECSVRGRVERPLSLAGDRDAYAVEILGDAMWPRFRPGRRLLVSPAAPVAIGDDVIVRLAGGDAEWTNILIKELVRRTAGIVGLRQFNPDVAFTVDCEGVTAVHKVIGEAI